MSSRVKHDTVTASRGAGSEGGRIGSSVGDDRGDDETRG